MIKEELLALVAVNNSRVVELSCKECVHCERRSEPIMVGLYRTLFYCNLYKKYRGTKPCTQYKQR